MYPFERFSEEAKRSLTLAQQEAERARHSYIGTEHLLLGLLRNEGSEAAGLLRSLGVELGPVRAAITNVLGRSERVIIQQIIPTSRVKKVIEIAFDEALNEGVNHVGTRHLLLALLVEGEGIAAHVLKDFGVTAKQIRDHFAGRPGEKSVAAAPGFAWAEPGARVLVHDEKPPYRLWEGRVKSRRDLDVTVAVEGHPKRKEFRVTLDIVHPVPPEDAGRCPRCAYREN